jgi:hypothetical protein
MDYTKEFLLASATGLMAYAMTLIQQNFWQGFILIVFAVALFVGRGFYKKYLEK